MRTWILWAAALASCAPAVFAANKTKPAPAPPAPPIAAPAVALPDPAKEPVVLATQQTLPCVVNINTEKLVVRTIQDPMDEMFNRYFGMPGPATRRTLQTVRSLGSGFFVDATGYIITNEHVVSRAADLKISISTYDGKTYPGKYVYGEAQRDLALIKIVQPEPAEPVPFLDMTTLSPNIVGQTVIALGNPIGFQSSVSVGILSGKDRTVGEVSGLLQTDAAINPGNSGGPLVDIAGRLVGVSSMKIAQNQGMTTENLGFAIPADAVADWTQNAIAFATGAKPLPQPADPAAVLKERFGVKLQNLTPELAQELGLRFTIGVLIADVDPGSPAAKAGIRPGMVLKQIGRYATQDIAALPKELGAINAGNEVTLVLCRVEVHGGVYMIKTQPVRLIAR